MSQSTNSDSTQDIEQTAPAKSIPNEQFVELFAPLPQEDQTFAKAIQVYQLRPGEHALSPEEMRDWLFILMEGHIRLSMVELDGRTLSIGVLPPGSVFGGERIYRFDVNPKIYAQAIEPCLLWKLDLSHAIEYLQRHPILALGMLRTQGRRLAQVENRLEEMAFRRLPERLAGELLRQYRRSSNNEVRISHQGLADILGTYRETISAILRDFKRENWVQLGYRRIIIKNPEALRTLSGYVYE